MHAADLKKKKNTHTQYELSFNWGEMRTVWGNSTSESSEKLLQRGKGKLSIRHFGEGGVHTIKHIFWQKFLS